MPDQLFPPLAFSRREILAFYYRYRRRLHLAFLLPLIIALVAAMLMSPNYKATSVLTVRLGSEFIYQPELGSTQSTPQSTIPYDRQQIFKAEVAILESADLHADVIRQIGAKALFGIRDNDVVSQSSETTAAMAKAIRLFDHHLDVALEKDSSVITVSYAHPDAALATKTLDALLTRYLEKRKELYLEPRVDRARTHAEEAHQRAQTAQKSVEDYKAAHDIHAMAEERAALMQQRGEVERLRANLKTPALDEREVYLDTQLDRLNQAESTLNVLTHDASVAADEYAVFAHRLSEAIAYEDLERERIGSVRVIQPPAVPARPYPLTLIILAAGFVLSLLSAVVTALLIDTLSSGFMVPEQIERALKLPVLTVISRR